MTVSDLLNMETDIDVIDDYDERCYIAFTGPMKLTDAGYIRFRDALGCKVTIRSDYVIIHIDQGAEWQMENQAEAVKDLFFAMAGYCSDENYQKWFIEEEEE